MDCFLFLWCELVDLFTYVIVEKFLIIAEFFQCLGGWILDMSGCEF